MREGGGGGGQGREREKKRERFHEWAKAQRAKHCVVFSAAYLHDLIRKYSLVSSILYEVQLNH